MIPGAEARKLAAVLGKEPALVELILDESREVLRAERSVLIVETHHGFVCANAGDRQLQPARADTVCLLPEDPDASARRIRAEIDGRPARRVGVVDRRQLRPGLAPRAGRGRDRLRRARPARRLARPPRRRRARAGGDPDRDRRRGRRGRRPGPRQGERRPGGDRPRPRPLRQRRGRPRRRRPAPAPPTRTSSARTPTPVAPVKRRRDGSLDDLVEGIALRRRRCRRRGRRRSAARGRAGRRAGSRPSGRCSPPSGCRRGR